MRATFWTVTAVVGAVWLVSFTWHLFMRDWMPPQATASVASVWSWATGWLTHRKGEAHGTDHPSSEVGDA